MLVICQRFVDAVFNDTKDDDLATQDMTIMLVKMFSSAAEGSGLTERKIRYAIAKAIRTPCMGNGQLNFGPAVMKSMEDAWRLLLRKARPVLGGTQMNSTTVVSEIDFETGAGDADQKSAPQDQLAKIYVEFGKAIVGIFQAQIPWVEITSAGALNSSNAGTTVYSVNRMGTVRTHDTISSCLAAMAKDYMVVSLMALLTPIDLSAVANVEQVQQQMVERFRGIASSQFDGPMLPEEYKNKMITPSRPAQPEPSAPPMHEQDDPIMAQMKDHEVVTAGSDNGNVWAKQIERTFGKLESAKRSELETHELCADLGIQMLEVKSSLEQAKLNQPDPSLKSTIGNFVGNVLLRVTAVAKRFMSAPADPDAAIVNEVNALAKAIEKSRIEMPQETLPGLEAAKTTVNQMRSRIKQEKQKDCGFTTPLLFPATDSLIDPSFVIPNEGVATEEPAVWDKRTLPCETSKLVRSPRLKFVNDFMSTNFSAPKWPGADLGGPFEEWFEETFEPYICTRLEDTAESYIAAIYYSFGLPEDREKYKERFIGRPVEVSGENWLRQLLRMISLEIDLENVKTPRRLAAEFHTAEEQAPDESMINLAARLRRLYIKWKGQEWKNSVKGRRTLVEKIVEKTTCPIWKVRFTEKTEFEKFNTLNGHGEGSGDYDRFMYLINYYSQYDMAKHWNGTKKNVPSAGGQKIRRVQSVQADAGSSKAANSGQTQAAGREVMRPQPNEWLQHKGPPDKDQPTKEHAAPIEINTQESNSRLQEPNGMRRFNEEKKKAQWTTTVEEGLRMLQEYIGEDEINPESRYTNWGIRRLKLEEAGQVNDEKPARIPCSFLARTKLDSYTPEEYRNRGEHEREVHIPLVNTTKHVKIR